MSNYKHFYDAANNKEIVDVSGAKTLAQIKAQFGNADYTETSYDPSAELIKIVDGTPSAVSLADHIQDEQDARASAESTAIDSLKTSLKLTDQDITNLRTLFKK